MLLQTPNLRFAIDGRMLDREGTGVSTYARAFRAALEMLGRKPVEMRDSHCGPQALPRGRIENWWRWSETCLDCPRWLWRRNMYARDIYRLAQVHFNRHGTLLRFYPGGRGVMHWTYPVPLLIEGWTNIYTVHDAIPITHPGLTAIDADRHRRLLTRIGERADRILTVSEAARQEILGSVDLAPDRVINCPPGLQTEHLADALPPGLRTGGYLLALGNIEPRKNLARLAAAHAASGTDLPLVVAGTPAWQAESIERMLAAQPGVVRLPFLSRPQLLRVIADARALLFPTLAEGFGLPIIEAMHLGTAVMTSRGGATEEVSGGAAILVDPLSVDDVAAAIGRLTHEDALISALVAAGRKRSEYFSVQAFAARIDAVHRQLP